MTGQSITAAHFGDNLKVVERSSSNLAEKSDSAARALIAALRDGKKIVAFGNGGSATQASHFCEELIGRFRDDRRPFPAVSLTADSAALTCIANDFGFGTVFERQVEALVSKGDVVVGLTTSGASENVLRGLRAARAKAAVTIALTGQKKLQGVEVDHLLDVPSTTSAHIQEVHLLLLHAWCIAIDAELGKS